MSEDGLIGLLEAQHDQLEGMLDRLPTLMGSLREQAFLELRQLIAVHEAIEQQLVHPRAKADEPGAADSRVAEELAAADLLTALERMDIESTEFETTFRGLQHALREHAEAEELTEFTALQDAFDDADLARARQAVERVESGAAALAEPFASIHEQAVRELG